MVDKKIIYASVYENGEKKSTSGFVRLHRENRGCIMEIHMKGLGSWQDGNYDLWLMADKGKALFDTLAVRQGCICQNKYLSFQKEFLLENNGKLQFNEIDGMIIQKDGENFISFCWKDREKQNLSLEKQEKHSESDRSEIRSACEEKIQATLPEKGTGSKWEQFCRYYRQLHPFGDNHVFIAIEPKDLRILKNPYRKLANNSFLLHGFYNYRHLILGPDRNQPLGGRMRFCLGVPGTYFEREKMVAIMFGFEGFECEGPVEIGKNGYYLREVDLL